MRLSDGRTLDGVHWRLDVRTGNRIMFGTCLGRTWISPDGDRWIRANLSTEITWKDAKRERVVL